MSSTAIVPTDAALFQAMCQVAYRVPLARPTVAVRGSHMQHTAVVAGGYEWNIDNDADRRSFVDWAERLMTDPKAAPREPREYGSSDSS